MLVLNKQGTDPEPVAEAQAVDAMQTVAIPPATESDAPLGEDAPLQLSCPSGGHRRAIMSLR